MRDARIAAAFERGDDLAALREFTGDSEEEFPPTIRTCLNKVCCANFTGDTCPKCGCSPVDSEEPV
jgi:hypothetical protein